MGSVTQLIAEMGITPVRTLPARRVEDAPAIGAGSRFALLQPFLGDTALALERRGAEMISARPARRTHPSPPALMKAAPVRKRPRK